MDLRDLSSTPTQMESVIQRRPSLSSLSSTSGYASSTYGNGPSAQQGNSTPQMTQLRMSTGNSQNRLYSGMLNNSSSTNLIVSAPGIDGVASNVAPWVEQQKQQQSLNVDSLDNGKKDVKPALEQSPAPILADLSTVTDTLDDDDELIPTAIVIKNIPFAIKKEQLLDVMTKLNLPLPYAFNYHFDNGVFRGLAFANFTSTDETSMVVNHLNGREIGGRKLRVEYKKMLPLQERERIEREKREKRGQLEEQHRSNSNASLASLISTASTTAATKNLSVNGQQFSTQTERLFIQTPLGNGNLPIPPHEVNFNDPEVLELYSQLLTFRDDNSKLILELAFSSNLSMNHRKMLSLLCSFLNLLELYDNGLIIIRRKPGQQTIQQRQQQSASFNPHLQPQYMGSLQPPASQQPPQGQPPNGGAHPHHSSSMMNLNQLPALLGTYPSALQTPNPHAPELLRSHSQSALPLPRLRQQTSTPVLQPYSQYQSSQHKPLGSQGSSKYQSYGYGGGSQGSSGQQQAQIGTPASSAAALLRSSNRSFVDVRSTPPLSHTMPSTSVTGSPTPQHSQPPHLYPGQQMQHGFFVGNLAQISQPGTPSGTNELNNRFAPFGQHAHLTGSFSSLQPASATSEDFPLNEPLANKVNGLNLNNGYEQQKSGGGIWGPQK